MYYIEINNRINQLLTVFYLFGFWRVEEDSCMFRKITRKFKFVILLLTLFISFVFGGLFSDDKSGSVYFITLAIVVVVEIVKLTYVLLKKEEIQVFIQDIGTHSVEDYVEFLKANEKVKSLMKFSFRLFLFICVAVAYTFISCLPVFSSERRLAINIWFPLDWKNSAISYWTAYVYLLIATIIGIIAASINTIIWYLLMNCAIKYQILGYHFRNIFVPKPTVENKKISKEEQENLFLQEFIRLIKTHRNIQETINRFKSCFGNLFFVQITTSGIGICGSVYGLAFGTYNGKLFQFAVNVSILLYNIFDRFMVMYLGNEIKLSSDRLSYCLFESNWLERSQKCTKYIIILTEVLKQSHELIISKLYPLNMKTFMSIANLAYSMFNILKNLK